MLLKGSQAERKKLEDSEKGITDGHIYLINPLS